MSSNPVVCWSAPSDTKGQNFGSTQTRGSSTEIPKTLEQNHILSPNQYSAFLSVKPIQSSPLSCFSLSPSSGQEFQYVFYKIKVELHTRIVEVVVLKDVQKVQALQRWQTGPEREKCMFLAAVSLITVRSARLWEQWHCVEKRWRILSAFVSATAPSINYFYVFIHYFGPLQQSFLISTAHYVMFNTAF